MRGVERIERQGTRRELLRKLEELAALPAFQHRPELSSAYLVGLMDDKTLSDLIEDLEAGFLEGLRR